MSDHRSSHDRIDGQARHGDVHNYYMRICEVSAIVSSCTKRRWPRAQCTLTVWFRRTACINVKIHILSSTFRHPHFVSFFDVLLNTKKTNRSARCQHYWVHCGRASKPCYNRHSMDKVETDGAAQQSANNDDCAKQNPAKQSIHTVHKYHNAAYHKLLTTEMQLLPALERSYSQT